MGGMEVDITAKNFDSVMPTQTEFAYRKWIWPPHITILSRTKTTSPFRYVQDIHLLDAQAYTAARKEFGGESYPYMYLMKNGHVITFDPVALTVVKLQLVIQDGGFALQEVL